jgi:hypothetical protein
MAAGSARLHQRAENYVADASHMNSPRDKTFRRFTPAQVQARQHDPNAERAATHRESELCRQKRASATKLAATKLVAKQPLMSPKM